ncbi:hypothetical protein AXF14_01420 [Actinomyces radicidentis]|uniref:LysM domain-containing protein n=2 Tax=Actinomyces radicidentis TaxID=111015 RepID=A0A0X8JDC8_ACTRD|nr:hypothetical protein AXF14_01420 [Actinomyces radicidentis]
MVGDSMRTSVTLLGVGTASPLLALALGAVARDAALRLAALPTAAWGPDQLGTCVLAVAAGAGALGALWHVGSVLLALVALAPGERWAPRRTTGGRRLALALLERWGAPVVRRAVIGSVLAGLLLPAGATAASAATTPAPDDLGWAPSTSAPASPSPTDATTEPTSAPQSPTAPSTASRNGSTDDASDGEGRPAPTAEPEESSAGAPESIPGSDGRTVRAGESLWSITADLLGTTATDGDVAGAWPELYRANAERIGDDPGLIRPGTELVLPSVLTTASPAQPS